jgi:hypothetical protein
MSICRMFTSIFPLIILETAECYVIRGWLPNLYVFQIRIMDIITISTVLISEYEALQVPLHV